MSTIERIATAVENGKRKEVTPLVHQAIEEGISAEAILKEGLLVPMDIIGEKFSAGDIFIPGMLVAARAMTAGIEVLKPYLAEQGTEAVGKAVIGTVKGDMHDIGKNLVRMMIESKGFEVVDLGVDVPPEDFVEFLKQNPETDIVCLSALLTTTMPALRETIEAIEVAGLRDSVVIMVGGAPVTQKYAKEIGADAYADDAGMAGAVALELVNSKNRDEIGLIRKAS